MIVNHCRLASVLPDILIVFPHAFLLQFKWFSLTFPISPLSLLAFLTQDEQWPRAHVLTHTHALTHRLMLPAISKSAKTMSPRPDCVVSTRWIL